ncbi:MAG: hypothetical protein V1717_04015 [Candidatus Micrarchaeota archaeon]
MKTPSVFLCVLLLATSFVFAQCPNLDVSLIESAQAETGVNAGFPVVITNNGVNAQLVSLSSECDYPLSCSFSNAPYATLYPTESATFLLNAKSSLAGEFQIPLSLSAGANANCDSKTLSLTAIPEGVDGQDAIPYDFDFTPTANQTARPGDEIKYSITVTNNEDSKVFVRFSAEGSLKETTFLQPVDIDLNAGQTKTIEIRVGIPPATPSQAYQMVFNARVTTSGGVQFYYSFPTQVFVYSEQLNLVLQNEPVSCTIAVHNQETQLKLRVRNDGEIEGPFDLELKAGENAFEIIDVFPKILEVKAGDSQEVTISIKPKPSTVLDTYYYQFELSHYGIPVFLKDYCFEVFAKTDFSIAAKTEYSVEKGTVDVLLPFTIYNDGSVTQNFAVEATPPQNLLVKIQPGSFSLSPGESKQVNLAVTPSRLMALGKTKLPVVVRTSKYSKAFALNITIAAEETGGKPELEFKQESIRAFAGVESRMFVSIQNNKPTDLHEAQLSFLGIPSAWYSATQSTLPAKSVQGIFVVFNIPSTQDPAAQKITAVVETAEGIGLEKQMVLYVEEPQSKLEAEFKESSILEGDGQRNLFVKIVVRNTGQKPLGGVKAIGPTGYAISTQPESLLLQPGQSTELTVKIENPTSESVSLRLQAEDGTTSSAVPVKIQPKARELPWMWILVAVIAILAIIFLFFRRQQEQYA